MPADDSTHESNGAIRKLIGAGADIAGASIGGALGFLAAAGAVASSLLKHVGDEVSERGEV